MTVGKGKRPRDQNQFAKWIVDRSTAEPTEEIIAPDKPAPLLGPIHPSGHFHEYASVPTPQDCPW